MDISNDQASHAAEPAGPGVQYGQQLDVQVPAVADVASRLSAAAAHVAATEEQLVAAEARVATAVAKAEASPRLAPAPAWRPSQRVTAVVAGLRERRQIAEAELELQRTVRTLTLALTLTLTLTPNPKANQVEGALLERAASDRQAELRAAMCRWTAAVVWRVRARLGAALLGRLAAGAADARRRS